MQRFPSSRRLNDGHHDNKRPRMSNEDYTKNTLMCQHGESCDAIACVSITGRDNVLTCLMHFVAQLDATDALVDARVALLDERRFHEQTSTVNHLWQQVIGDVVMQMYQHQWQEEKTLAADPLSILTLNAPLQKKQLAQTMGGAVVHTQVNAHLRDKKPQSNTKTAPPVDSGVQKVSNLYVQNPYARREPDRSNLFISQRTSTESHAQALLREEHDGSAEEEAANNAYREGSGGDICGRCDSPWVVVRTYCTFDGTRNEIWGSKDAQSSYDIECRKCKHIEHHIEGV